MDQIRLENIIPTTLKDRNLDTSDIWNKKLFFEKGTFYLIKAASGTGKSTFINSIYGIRKDYSGHLFYDSVSVKELNSDQLSNFRKSELSIVFQDLRLFDQLTAKENIILKSNSHDLDEEQKSWCQKLNVDRFINQPCYQLSYGERQRVAIIRALSQDFHFIFLDEPFSHLDEVNGKNAYDIILEVAKNKKASVIITSLGNEKFIQTEKTLTL